MRELSDRNKVFAAALGLGRFSPSELGLDITQATQRNALAWLRTVNVMETYVEDGNEMCCITVPEPEIGDVISKVRRYEGLRRNLLTITPAVKRVLIYVGLTADRTLSLEHIVSACASSNCSEQSIVNAMPNIEAAGLFKLTRTRDGRSVTGIVKPKGYAIEGAYEKYRAFRKAEQSKPEARVVPVKRYRSEDAFEKDAHDRPLIKQNQRDARVVQAVVQADDIFHDRDFRQSLNPSPKDSISIALLAKAGNGRITKEGVERRAFYQLLIERCGDGQAYPASKACEDPEGQLHDQIRQFAREEKPVTHVIMSARRGDVRYAYAEKIA